jgi:hypothetical protein
MIDLIIEVIAVIIISITLIVVGTVQSLNCCISCLGTKENSNAL